MANEQSQKARDGAVQVQVKGENVFVVGIDEKRAREIYSEMNSIAMKNYTSEAIAIAKERCSEFESRLMSKISALDDGMKAFANPGFQLLLVEAQKRAAVTERTVDYDLLSELMVYRFQKGENRNTRVGINRAVEIVDQIEDDALLGLTVYHSVSTFIPAEGGVFRGLDVLNDFYGKIIYGRLPVDNAWLDHLDILDAVRISPSSMERLVKIEEYYPGQVSGYIDVGIQKYSEQYKIAIDILNKANLPLQIILVDHELKGGYVRLKIPNEKSFLSNITLTDISNPRGQLKTEVIELSAEQKDAINSVYKLYKNDDAIKAQNIEKLMEEWNKRPHLKIVREWWDSIPLPFSITPVGKVLAHANAQRCDKNLPALV
jgi:hypothetical protein